MPRCSHTCGSPALMPPCLDTRQQTKCCPQGAKEVASVGAGSSRAQAIAHLTICYQTPCSSQVSQPYRCHSSTMRSIPRGEIRNHSARSIFPLHVPGSDASLKCDGMGEAAKMRANFRRSDAEGCGRQSGRYLETRSAIPAGRLIEIKYQDLVSDQKGTLAMIYEHLQLELPPVLRDSRRRDYQPNRHPDLTPELKKRIRDI